MHARVHTPPLNANCTRACTPPQLCLHACLQALYVAQHEEGAVSYQLSQGGEDPDEIMIFER